MSAAELASFRAAHAFWIADWERFAGAGAAADQVRFEREWSALRRYAASRGVRLIGDIPLYVGARSADHLRASRALSARLRRRRPARRAQRGRGSCGAIRSTTGPRCGAAATAGGSSACAGRRSSCDLARIDHFRGFVAYWSVPARARSARAGRWRRGPGRAVFDAATARARRAAADRRGPGRDHAAGRAPAAGARPARHGRAAVRLRRRSAQPAPAREPRRAARRLHGHARHGDGRRLVELAQPEGARRDRPRPRRAALVADRARARVAAPCSRSCPRRTCSASAARRA